MTDPVVSQRAIQVEHVRIEFARSFAEVKAAFENGVPRLDAGILALLQQGEIDRVRSELERGPELAIFSSRDHGALLEIAASAVQSGTIRHRQSADCHKDDPTPVAGLTLRAIARRAVRKRGRSRDIRI